MPWRSDKWRGRRHGGAMLAIVLLAAVCQEGRADDSNSTSTVADKWQKARQGSSNAWESVKQGSSNAWSSVKTGTTQSWERVRETFEPARGKTNYLYEKKDAFVAKAKMELDEMDDQIQQLSDKTASAGESVKAEMRQKMDTLKSKRTDLSNRYDDAKKATGEQWNKAQAGFQKAYDDTKTSVKDAWDWLKSKTSG